MRTASYLSTSSRTNIDWDKPETVAFAVQEVLSGFRIAITVESIVVGPSVIRVNISQPKRPTPLKQEERIAMAADYLLRRGIKATPEVTRYVAERVIPSTTMRQLEMAEVARYRRELAAALRVPSVRVDHDAYGFFIEVPRPKRDTILAKAVLRSRRWREQAAQHTLPLALGLDAYGNLVTADLAAAPHALIAGTTNSGKSNTLHMFVASLASTLPPDTVRIYLADFKGGIELHFWQDLPHLGAPVASDEAACIRFLTSVQEEITRRYRLMREANARSLAEWNQTNPTKAMPYLVVIMDEVAELVHRNKGAAVDSLLSLSQTARSAGVHFVICLQRPSADIISLSISANYTLRIAHYVAPSNASVNSRIILGVAGAENLLGRGDALVVLPGETAGTPKRIQVPFVTTDYIQEIVHAQHH